jgi:hypothetical protein
VTEHDDNSEKKPDNHNMHEKSDPNDLQKYMGDGVIKQSLQYWIKAGKDRRLTYLNRIHEYYYHILRDFFKQANLCTDNFKGCDQKYARIRNAIILATGIMAIINIFAACMAGLSGSIGSMVVSVFAAIYAAALTVLVNFENHYKYADRTQRFRQIRELYLDAAREFEKDWPRYVEAFSDEAVACLNASKLCDEIYKQDIEIRKKAIEIEGKFEQKSESSTT